MVGTLYSELERLNLSGRIPVLETELEGMKAIRGAEFEAMFVYIIAPSIAEMKARIRERGENTEESIQQRARIAERQIAQAEEMGEIDLWLVNDDFEEAKTELLAAVDQFFGVAGDAERED